MTDPSPHDLIFPAIVDGAQRLGALDDKGVGTQFYELIGRNINIASGAVLNAKEFAAEAELDRLKAGTPLFQTPDGRILDSPRYLRAGPLAQPLTDEQRAARIAKIEHTIARFGLDRQLENLATNGYDAVRNRHTGILGFLETGLYGTASSAGFTGLAMLPGGAFLAMAASASEEYTKLRAEHPEIAPSDARLIAAVSGVIQGCMERVQGRWFLGTLPTVEKAMNELANPVITSGLKRTFIRGGITAVGENVVEGAQDLTTPILMNIANALQMDVPGVSAMDILMPWAGQRADVAAGLSLMLIGSLFGINARDRRMLNSPEQRQRLLELTGFSPEQISRIEQGSTVEEKLAKAREELANRNQADISRGAKIYQAELDAANAKHFDPEQTRALSPTLMMSKQGDATPADIGRHWMKIAEDPDTAILGETPTEREFRPILDKLAGPDAQNVKIVEEKFEDGTPSGVVTFREGEDKVIVLDAMNPHQVYVNSVDAGDMGTPIYQAIYAWAYNNGKRIVPDPGGLSEIAVLRRTSQMLSSALRFGSTRHFYPSPEQKLDGWELEDSAEATAHNIGLLAIREAELVKERLPRLSDLHYNNGEFYDGDKAIRSEDRDSHIGSRIEAIDPDFAQGAGPTTVARALVTAAAQRSGNRTGGLVGTPAEKASLAQIRYSQARENDKSDLSPNSSGSKQAEVTDWALSTLKDWRKDISVKIHDSADHIPDENLRQTVLNADGIVEGFYNPADRSIHILADRMNSEADVQRVLRHEGMHWAFANALQKEYRELLAGARAKIPDDKLKELLAKYPKASDSTIVEEYLAYEGQNNPKSTVWVTFAYEAKRLLRKVFGDRVQFTDKDILAFLSKANRRLTDRKAGYPTEDTSSDKTSVQSVAAENRSEESTADDLTKMPEPDMTSFDVGDSEPLTGPDAERAVFQLNTALEEEGESWRASLISAEALHKSQRTEAARLARGIAALFGRRVVIFKADKDDAPNAVVNTSMEARKVIFLNNLADRPHLLTIGHELYHHIELSSPTLAAQLRAELEPLLINRDLVHAEKFRYTEDRRIHEVIGDLIGSSLADRKFWHKLEAGNPALFSKVAVIVRDWLTKVINALNQAGLRGNKHFTDLERARNIVADALVEFSKHPFSGKGKIGPYELYDPNQNFYEDSSGHHLQESESRRRNAPELDLEEGDRARKLLDNFQPVKYPVPNLPKSDNLLPYWDWFKANLENRTFTSPIGKLVPFKRGQFLKLIAGGANKGFIPGATNWKEIVEKIEGGQVHLDNPETAPSGFEQYRARNMPLIPDVVQEPHVILRSKDDPRTLIFLKKYELDKVSIWQGVFVDLGDEAAIKSWRPRNRISEDWLKDHLLVWEKK